VTVGQQDVPPGAGSARRIAVVGAGIVGVSCAWQLQARGYDVTLIDRQEPGEAASFGNAGVISTSSILPLVGANTWRKVPGWLADPSGPLRIGLRDLPKNLAWFRAAQANATMAKAETVARALNDLHGQAVEDHFNQANAAGCAHLLVRSNYLHVYRTVKGFEADLGDWERRRALGVGFQTLGPSELAQAEPALAPDFARGMLVDGHGTALDPGGLVKALWADFRARQGRVVKVGLRRIVPMEKGVCLVTDADEIRADRVVLAAGAWSAEIAHSLGHRFPLTSARGYHVVFPDTEITLKSPVMLAEEKVAVTSMSMGLRVAGTAEFTAPHRPANPRRWAMLEKLAARSIRGALGPAGSRWHGPRPSLPDTLPVIGPSELHPAVIFAFGHGHTGLTASASTARAIAALIAGEAPPFDLYPFRPGRFPVAPGKRVAS